MGGQPLPEPKDANLRAAVNAGAKANAKQATELWREKEAPKFFIARGGCSMIKGINRSLLVLVLDKVADVSHAVTKQLRTLANRQYPQLLCESLGDVCHLVEHQDHEAAIYFLWHAEAPSRDKIFRSLFFSREIRRLLRVRFDYWLSW